MSSNDRQLLEDMRVGSPKSNRLTTIDEGLFGNINPFIKVLSFNLNLVYIYSFIEKSRMRSKFLKSNKLNPYDDKTEIEPKSRNTSWAITDHQSSFKIFIKKI